MNLKRIGAAAGFGAPIVGFICIFIAVVFYPDFNWLSNALSDLGVAGGLTGALFNLGLLSAGVLGFLFASLGLFSYVGRSWVGKVGSAVFAAACIAVVCIGIFNENFSPTHYLVSVAFFTLAPIALFILTCAFTLNHQGAAAAFTVAVGIIASLPWILEFTLYYVEGVAVPETISGLAVSVWVIVLSTKIQKKA